LPGSRLNRYRLKTALTASQKRVTANFNKNEINAASLSRVAKSIRLLLVDEQMEIRAISRISLRNAGKLREYQRNQGKEKI